MIIFQSGRKFSEHKYNYEQEFEKDIVEFREAFFGAATIYIDAKKAIGSQSLGNAIPDGFLFDMTDPQNREFYLVEVELESHDFFGHIFPQITKFFAFFRDSKRQKDLVEKLYATIDRDAKLRDQFAKHLGTQEVFKFLTDVIDSSQRILLIIDGEKPELPEIMNTYSDTWGKTVKLLTLKKYTREGECAFTMEPEFDAIEYSYQEALSEEGSSSVAYSEEFHLEGVSDTVKAVYNSIKASVAEADLSYLLNPQKYYISIKGPRNIAYMELRKKKVRLTIMLPEEEIRASIRNYSIRSLSDSVQKYYNGPCAAVYVDGLDHIDEILDVIKRLMVKHLPVPNP